jgi:conserved oligomeric Golgi complex subunit 4
MNGNVEETDQVNGFSSHKSELDTVKDIYSTRSVAEIKATLAKLRQKEATVTSNLDVLIASQKDLQRDLGKVDFLRASLSAQASKARTINNGMLSDAARTANKISDSVKQLDLEQSRVTSTLEVVEQISQLKACVLGVAGSMGAAQDWETAASYLSRASKIPRSVIDSAYAARVVPTAEVPDAPGVTLSNASESLCGLFLREFDKAVKDNDGSRITRFFKLFPLIGKSEVGLDVYGRYVCQGVATRARTNLNAGTGGNQSKDGFFYANALTKLFEHVAQIVDGHGGLVERHYGPGKMVRVIERLQSEADVQGGIIIDTWADERRIDRLLTDIKSYAFTFLVQSFLPQRAGTPRSSSPAPARSSEDEGVDMKEVDATLNEATVMLGRWTLYTKFIRDKCGDTEMPGFLLNSSLMKKINVRLVGPFSIMTTFFFRRSVEKAFQLDEQPPDLSLNPHKPLNDNPPHVTSAVDDIMFIVNKMLQQALATSQDEVVRSVGPMVGRVLGSDFLGMIQRKMRDESYPKAAIAGALPPEHTIVSFIVLINDLDVAVDYVSRIANSADLKSLTTSFTEATNVLLVDGLNVLFNNVMKPRLRPILLDAFRDAEYGTLVESDESGSEEAVDVGARFQHGWEALTRPIARLMTEKTFDRLFGLITSYLSKMLEKRIWASGAGGHKLSEIGGVRLERDMNAVIAVVVQGRKYGAKSVFDRCVQICSVMNMEGEEWQEVQRQGPDIVVGQLSEEERVRAREMVVRG